MSGCAEAEEMNVRSVFHSVDSVLQVLKSDDVKALSEVQYLLSQFYSTYPEGVESFSHTIPRRKLFIVFEGLDGSGKSTIAAGVRRKLHGVFKSTPPNSISSIRKNFDLQDSLVRRAYYSLGNYIAVKEIHDICQRKPVFVDRFWHSTSAYAIAQEFDGQGESGLPPKGHPVYKWPVDLMKPDLVLFLDVDEETRRSRHERRQQTTKEEDQLAKDQAFRNLVLAAFNRMDGVPVVHVDSSQSIERTVSDCIDHIKHLSSTA